MKIGNKLFYYLKISIYNILRKQNSIMFFTRNFALGSKYKNVPSLS